MKVPNRDNCKYSINLKIFKLQPTTINGGTGNGDKKSSSLLVPMPPMQPTLQRKRNSWRNAWKLANYNSNNKTKNSIKINSNLNSNSNCNVNVSLEDEKKVEIVSKAQDNKPSLEEQVKNDTNNNTINHEHQTPLDDEHILCKFAKKNLIL